MNHRSFTVAEANALVPVVDAILAEVQARTEGMHRSSERLQILDLLWGPRLLDEDSPDHAEAEELRQEIARHLADIREIVEREILGRGLRFPPGGLEHGLIDFPSTWNGRPIFLCWRRGEPAIQAWHEVDSGFAGRQALTEEQTLRMGREGDPLDYPDGPGPA